MADERVRSQRLLRAARIVGTVTLVALAVGTKVSDAAAQGAAAGSETAVGPEAAQTALALIRGHLRSPDARVTGLRWGRDRLLCGAVDVRNRMGTYTGPRPFVVDLDAGFAGRLPEDPELRHPASPDDYRMMERARTLFIASCIDG